MHEAAPADVRDRGAATVSLDVLVYEYNYNVAPSWQNRNTYRK